jgi:hypothetical protein
MRWGGPALALLAIALAILPRRATLSSNGPSRYCSLSAWHGALGVSVMVKGGGFATPRSALGWRLSWTSRGRNPGWDWGFSAKKETLAGMTVYSASLPLWVPFVIGAGMTFAGWHRAKAAESEGVCPSCGYDLSGLSRGSACPECAAQP